MQATDNKRILTLSDLRDCIHRMDPEDRWLTEVLDEHPEWKNLQIWQIGEVLRSAEADDLDIYHSLQGYADALPDAPNPDELTLSEVAEYWAVVPADWNPCGWNQGPADILRTCPEWADLRLSQVKRIMDAELELEPSIFERLRRCVIRALCERHLQTLG